ncbi:MAG: S-layer homology domain-containing protein [Clostridiales bacterium]
MKKSYLAVLLALIMVFSVSGGAFAAGDFTTTDDGKTMTGYTGNATEIDIPNTVTKVMADAFRSSNSENIAKVTTIKIPASVTSIAIVDGSFQDCENLTSFVVDKDNAEFKDIDGVLYTKDGKTLVSYPIAKADKEFTVPADVTTIGISAFRNSKVLEKVEFNAAIVGEYAFARSRALSSVVVGADVKKIGIDGLGECVKLNTVEFLGAIPPVSTEAQYHLSESFGLTSVCDKPILIVPVGTRATYLAKGTGSEVDNLDNVIVKEKGGKDLLAKGVADLRTDLTIDADETLNIPQGSSLMIRPGINLINKGTINGIIVNSGTIDNTGTINNQPKKSFVITKNEGITSYDTFIEAIKAAKTGDIVQLGVGAYDGNITVANKSISILGANAINSPNSETWSKEQTILTGGMVLSADGAKSNITVKGITFKNKGLMISGAENILVENNKVENIVKEPYNDAAAMSGIAIYNQKAITNGKTTVKNNYVKDCKALEASGIRVNNLDNIDIIGNTVENAYHNSILLQTDPTPTSPVAKVNILNNTLINWDADNDTQDVGGRAIRLQFNQKAANAANQVTVNGNVMTKANWAASPVDNKELVKITNGAAGKTGTELKLDLTKNYWNGAAPTVNTAEGSTEKYAAYPCLISADKDLLMVGPSEVSPAPLADNQKGTDGKVTVTPITLATYEAKLSGSIVYLAAKDVPYHTNGAGTEGNWVGIKIAMPKDTAFNAADVTYSFGNEFVDAPDKKIGAFDVIDGANYYTFYANAGATPKTKITIDWDGVTGKAVPVKYTLDLNGVSVLPKVSGDFELISVNQVTYAEQGAEGDNQDYYIDRSEQTVPVLAGNEIKLTGVIPYYKANATSLGMGAGNLFSIKIATANIGENAKIKVQNKDGFNEYSMKTELNKNGEFYLCGNIAKDKANMKFIIDQDGNWSTTKDAKTYTITWADATFATEKLAIEETVQAHIDEGVSRDDTTALSDIVNSTRVNGIATATSADVINAYGDKLGGTAQRPAEVEVCVKVNVLPETNLTNNILSFSAKPYIQQKLGPDGMVPAAPEPISNADLKGEIKLCFALPDNFVVEGLQVRHIKENGKTEYLIPRIFSKFEHGVVRLYAEITITDFSKIVIENSTTFNINYISNLPQDATFVNPNTTTAVKVSEGVLPLQLKDASAEGYVFEGWYLATTAGSVEKITELTGGNINDFAYNKNIKIYARWSNYNPTVTFDSNYQNAPGATPVQVVKGNQVIAPDIAPRPGYALDGWFTDKECTVAVDFKAKINRDVTYFAKWTKVGAYNPYVDINGHWAFDEITAMTAKGLFNGEIVDGVNYFYPERFMSRAEFVTVLARLDKVDVTKYPASDCTFTDIDEPTKIWAGSYITWAQKHKIVRGETETLFAPNMAIDRQEMSEIIGNYLAYRNVKVDAKWEDVTFKDKNTIADWAKDSTAICAKLGIIEGTETGEFLPLKNMTRAEGATVLQRISKYLNI